MQPREAIIGVTGLLYGAVSGGKNSIVINATLQHGLQVQHDAGRSEKLWVTLNFSIRCPNERETVPDTQTYLFPKLCIITILFARNHKLLSILLNVIHAFEIFHFTMNSVYNSVR